MGTAARTLIDRAYARSTYNDADVLATDSELIARLDYRLTELFGFINQEATPADAYFGVEAEVAAASNAWAKPADMDVLLAVRNASGDKVNVVPYNDRTGEVPPRIYPLGASYNSVGTADDPDDASDALTFFYARFPEALDPTKTASDADNELDDAWPARFDNLLVVDLALYLSNKDARFAVDSAALLAEQEGLMMLLQAHVLRTNRAMRSRFGQRRRVEQLQAGQG